MGHLFAIILAHNHPSVYHSVTLFSSLFHSSSADLRVTKLMIEASKTIDWFACGFRRYRNA